MKPFHKSREHRRALKAIQQRLGDKISEVHICTYAAPFGVTPQELDEVYPLSQYEIATPFDAETIEHTAKQVSNYIANTNYKGVVLLEDSETWKEKIARACKKACEKKKVYFKALSVENPWKKNVLNGLAMMVQELFL
jgi:predicted RNA-binding protein